ncbi:cytochrome c maturation protein CcmE [Desulfovibrio cuneatus]|uniref:cytochrome c maturation protein CcmE n=1 Tax=Desulfovibrio cuneatus TaxID=159728 RepID=UPI0004163BB9|nr:cytochrome c maturation protein CcmE [Desulfovibrio cuneatus]
MKVAALLFVLGIGYLTFSGLFENSIYYVGVAEALELTPKDLTTARIFGTVKPEDLSQAANGQGVTFFLADSADTSRVIRVVYKGMVPDTFKAGAEVFVEGSIDHANTSFNASTLVTKCPSKYQKENRT